MCLHFVQDIGTDIANQHQCSGGVGGDVVTLLSATDYRSTHKIIRIGNCKLTYMLTYPQQ